MQKSERVNFGSKIGAVLAAAGSGGGAGEIYGGFPMRREIMEVRHLFWYTWRVFLCWECLL